MEGHPIRRGRDTTPWLSARHRVLIPFLTTSVLSLIGIINLLSLGLKLSELFVLDEIGYGDSYILYDVLHFERTGLIYRDLSLPPYLPAQYSPVVYALFALAHWLFGSENPFVGPRLIVLCAFAACVCLSISLVRALVAEGRAWAWTVLLVSSTASLCDWLLQLRADFIAIALGLLSLRLLISERRWALPLAGLCAGFALQFKLTFVTAGLTGMAWLALQRRWSGLFAFSAAGAASSVGLYLLYLIREPGMLSQITALVPGVADVRGALRILSDVLTEPVVVLAIVGAPAVMRRHEPRWLLMSLFAVISFGVATLTVVQAGANVNYYFEPMFALVPFGVAGLFELRTLAHQRIGLVLLVWFLCAVLPPRAVVLYRETVLHRPAATRNAELAALERVVRRHRILSTLPRIALFDDEPTLMEPYLLSYLHRVGRFDPGPILDEVRRQRFDGVFTSPTERTWRGVPHIDDDLRAAIAESYRPYCTLPGLLLHLPAAVPPGTSELGKDLERLGCTPLPGGATPDW
jgi:hypothetical protein